MSDGRRNLQIGQFSFGGSLNSASFTSFLHWGWMVEVVCCFLHSFLCSIWCANWQSWLQYFTILHSSHDVFSSQPSPLPQLAHISSVLIVIIYSVHQVIINKIMRGEEAKSKSWPRWYTTEVRSWLGRQWFVRSYARAPHITLHPNWIRSISI